VAGQRRAASWCRGVGAFTGGTAMGGVLVWKGGGVYCRGSHRRRLGVEGWRPALAGQRWAAYWCGGVGASAVGAQGLVVSRGGAAMGGALVWRGGGVYCTGSHRGRLGVEGWRRALAGHRWVASWCEGVEAFTGGAAMGAALVSRGAGAYWRDSDGRRLGLEGWGRLLSGQPSGASRCGGVAASTGGAAMASVLV